MAYTSLKISIPTPCHEDWTGMTPVAGTTARHCDSCAKNVTDFTGFTDEQLHAYARNKRGRLCGRFRSDQLNRPIRAATDRRTSPIGVAAATAGLLLTSGLAAGQTAGPATGETTELGAKDTGLEHIRAINARHLRPGEGTNAAGQPDSLPLPPPEMGKIALEPDTTEVLLGDISLEPEPIFPPVIHAKDPVPPPPEYPVVMGIVIAEPPRPRGIDWVKDSLQDLLPRLTLPTQDHPAHPRPRPENAYLESLTISPNPFDREFRLRLTVPVEASLVVEVLNASGELIHGQIWNVVAGDNTVLVAPKKRKVPAGIYFVRLTDFRNFEVMRTVVKR